MDGSAEKLETKKVTCYYVLFTFRRFHYIPYNAVGIVQSITISHSVYTTNLGCISELGKINL